MVENPAPQSSVVVNVSNGNVVPNSKVQEQQYYAVRVTSEKAVGGKIENGLSKIVHTNAPQQMAAYNLNAINLAALKPSFSKSDGINEIINIEPDTLNSIISNSNLRKFKSKGSSNGGKKGERSDVLLDSNMIQIDLTHPESAYEIPLKNDKLKSSHEPKYMYTFKIEESSKNPAILLNQIPANVPQIQNFDPSLMNLASSVPQSGINLNANNSKADSETNMPLKAAASMNSSILGTLGSNLNLNLTGTNLNIVASNMNQGIIPNLSVPSNSNQNVSMASSMNLTNLPPVPTNVNNQNINLNIAASYSNVSQSFATTPVTTYQNSTVNKNALANLAVISRISNLNQSKNPPVPQEAAENLNNSFNTVIFNGNPPSSLENSSANSAPTTTTTKTHVCDICQKIFKRREHLYQHVKLHIGFRPFVCDHCSKSFMRKEHLQRHMISHSGQKNYTCNICDKSFSRNDNLLKHKKTHEKQQSFTCEVCQKQFVMKHYYLAHKMAHEDEKVSFNQTWNNIVKV